MSGCFDLARAQQPGQTTFASAEQAIAVEKANRWYFEPAASKAEIVLRRIGRNELETIQFCRDSMVFILAVRQFGPLLPPPNTEDYAKETIEPRPLSGYYYRILRRQGKHAPGGAKSYVVNGKMTGGFAFVAYPAAYRSSGVMTFIVNQDGIVYQKDLGSRTAIRAKTLTQYDPDETWKKVE